MIKRASRPFVFAVAVALLATLALRPLEACAMAHELVWADGLDINILNPLLPGAAPNNYLTQITMAFLTVSGNGPVEAELAVAVPSRENGGISADGKTITFDLRPNLKWSDGQPLTSADVAFSVALINDPKTNIPGRTGYDLITRVDTPTKTRVVMHLAHAYGPVLRSIFNDSGAPIFPKHLLAGKDINTASYMQLPVGSGPFRYTKWLRGDRVELEANPYYFRGMPKLKKIVYLDIPSSQSSVIAMQTGESDLWPQAAPDDAAQLKDVPSLRRSFLVGVRPSILLFNTSSPMVADARVRKALRLGLNRASILLRAYRSEGVLDESIVSRTDPAYAHVPQVPYDQRRAAALLDAAGWKIGPDGNRSRRGLALQVSLVGVTGSVAVEQVLELVRADWERLGVVVNTRYYLPSILFSASANQGILTAGKFDVATFSYGQIRSSTLASSFSCAELAPRASNYSRICDGPLERLFTQYNATYDVEVQTQLAHVIQRRLSDRVPYIIVAKRNEYFITRNTVTGYRPQPFSPFAGGIMNVDDSK